MDLAPYQDRLDKFFNKVATLQHYQRLTQSNTKQVIEDVRQRQKNLESLREEDREVFGRSISVFSFYNPFNGTLVPYASKQLSLEETAKLVFEHKNKQYQWLLVEAYELYEDFVVSFYEFIRTAHAELRFPKDVDGLLPPTELKKKVPQIVSRLRAKLAELKDIEVTNLTQKNLRLHLCMIEKFRHVIVHRNGVTTDSQKLVEDILKKANLLGDSVNEPAARGAVSNYLGTGAYEGYIVLEEHSIAEGAGLSIHINRHEILVGALMEHALALVQCVVNLLGAPAQKS